VKAVADASAACNGRARNASVMPSSSRRWVARASRAVSCSATCRARPGSRPRSV